MVSSGELAYQQLCNEITMEFNDCSKQVMTTSYYCYKAVKDDVLMYLYLL